MTKSKILIGFAIILYVLFVFFQINKDYNMYTQIFALIVPTITGLYFLKVKNRPLFFSLFLIFFSISELGIFASDRIPYMLDYYGGNGLYIAAYSSLCIEFIKKIDFKFIYKNYLMHTIILLILNIYLMSVLYSIVKPSIVGVGELIIELSYNASLLLALSFALLKYFCEDNHKALLLFFGALSIVLSEVVQLAYLYMSETNALNLSYSSLLVLAFSIFYYQATLNDKKVNVIA